MNSAPSPDSPPPLGDEEEAYSGKVIDPDSFRRLNEVRKDLYKGAVTGLVGGSLLGAIGFHLSAHVPALRRLRSKNTLVASVMLGGAFGSFLFSLMRGQQSVVYLGDVFGLNAKPKLSPYMSQMKTNERALLSRGERGEGKGKE